MLRNLFKKIHIVLVIFLENKSALKLLRIRFKKHLDLSREKVTNVTLSRIIVQI